jgi:hypothetical protein
MCSLWLLILFIILLFLFHSATSTKRPNARGRSMSTSSVLAESQHGGSQASSVVMMSNKIDNVRAMKIKRSESNSNRQGG